MKHLMYDIALLMLVLFAFLARLRWHIPPEYIIEISIYIVLYGAAMAFSRG